MKVLTLFAFCLTLFSPVFAQDEGNLVLDVPENKTDHELGVNSIFFIKTILDFGGDNIPVAPYAISYKLICNRHALRTAIGGNIEKTDEPEINREGTDNEWDYRIGYEYRKPLGRRWLTYFGVDLTGHYSEIKVEVDDGFDVVTTSESRVGFGAGPVWGIQVYFNDRISLHTETAFYLMNFNTKSEVKSELNPFFNFEEKGNEFEAGFHLPAALYFTITL